MIFFEICLFNIIECLDLIEDFKSLSIVNKYTYNICKKYKINIYKYFLKKYNVDYHDPSNFIYKINNVNISNYINDTIDYNGIFLLYYNYYNELYISCLHLRITSIPIYPHLEHLNCNHNDLTSLPHFPSLYNLTCDNNKLTIINSYPKLIWLSCDNNNITEISYCPNLNWLFCKNNLLKTLPSFPKLKILF